MKEKYLVLLGETIQKIDGIDKQMRCDDVNPNEEPLWWLDMMELKRHLAQKLDHYIQKSKNANN